MREALEIAEKNYMKLGRRQTFRVGFLGEEHIVSPSGGVTPGHGSGETPVKHKIIILHYLVSGEGNPETGELIDFKSLPGGMAYNPVFEGRACRRLAGVFGENPAGLLECGKWLGGVETGNGDASMKFEVLPRVPVHVIIFSGGGEFPPAVKILFDRCVEGRLPTEDIIIICEELSKKLSMEAKKCR